MKKTITSFLAMALCLACTAVAWASPATGDSSHMGLWIAMVGVAVVAAVVVLILLKKKK